MVSVSCEDGTKASAQRRGDEPLYTELRFQPQAVQYAFPERETSAKRAHGPALKLARAILDQVETKPLGR